jgi:hypothetical protein
VKRLSALHKKKISEGKKKYVFTAEHRAHISEAGQGKVMSEETKQKIRDAMSGGVYHHIKYYELHGEDVTVFMTQSEHQKLHKRLRKAEKCNIPPDELNRISDRARFRRMASTRPETSIYIFLIPGDSDEARHEQENAE